MGKGQGAFAVISKCRVMPLRGRWVWKPTVQVLFLQCTRLSCHGAEASPYGRAALQVQSVRSKHLSNISSLSETRSPVKERRAGVDLLTAFQLSKK